MPVPGAHVQGDQHQDDRAPTPADADLAHDCSDS
jgi:hypothetical protein